MQSCPKRFRNGPCGGYRGKECEVGNRECIFIKAYSRLSKENLAKVLTNVVLDNRFLIRNYIPIPPRRPTTKFMKALSENRTLIIYEVFLKVNRGVNEVVKNLSKLAKHIVLAVTDSPLGTLTYDPITLSLKLLNDLRPHDLLINLAVRNKTLDELVMKIITANKLGLRNYLLVSGDWNFKGVSEPFYDLDTTEGIYLTRLVLDLGFDCRGKVVTTPLLGHVGGVANQYSEYLDIEVLRNVRKGLVGAEYLILQPVYDIDLVKDLIKRLRNYGFSGYVIPSYAPVTNEKHIKLLNKLGVNTVSKELIKAANTSLDNALRINHDYVLSIMESLGTNYIYISTYGNLIIAKEFLKLLINSKAKN